MRHVTGPLTLRGRCFLAAGAALVVCGLVLGFREITRLGLLVGGLPILVGLIGVRRGLQLSPELARGLWLTLTLAVLATAGRVIIPIVVQRVTDHGLLAPGGIDTGVVTKAIGFALAALVVTSSATYLLNVRLFRAAESGLATLRITAFRHLHDLSMLTQSSQRRGSMVSRVTSDVDTISQFVQFGGIILLVSLGQILLATALMAHYSPILAAVTWGCFVPLLIVVRRL